MVGGKKDGHAEAFFFVQVQNLVPLFLSFPLKIHCSPSGHCFDTAWYYLPDVVILSWIAVSTVKLFRLWDYRGNFFPYVHVVEVLYAYFIISTTEHLLMSLKSSPPSCTYKS